MNTISWLVTKIIRLVGARFDGYKTRIGGFGLILTGIVAAINLVWPATVPGLPEMDLDQIIGAITGGMIAIGLGGKIDKNTAAVQTASNQPVQGKPTEGIKG
jgi:hypothetical protein